MATTTRPRLLFALSLLLAGLVVLLALGPADDPRPGEEGGGVRRAPDDAEPATLVGTGGTAAPAGADGAAAQAPAGASAPSNPPGGPSPPAAVTTTPPDVLEAVILDGGVPIEIGTGLLWRGGVFTTAGQIPVGAEAVRTVSISRDGVLRFDGLEAGPWYLGVDLGDGVRRLHYSQRTTGAGANPRLLLGLGRAGLRGRIWGPDGRPVEGAVVRVGSAGADPEGFIAQIRTAADGTYAIERLAAGLSWVTICLDGNLDNDATNHHRHVVLEDGRFTTVDFGTPRGLVRLRGVVRCEDGAPVTGGGRIVLSRADGEGFLVVLYDDDGAFDQHVPEATYRFDVWPPGGTALQAFRDEVPRALGPADGERDLVLPGARVRGRVLANGPGPLRGYVSIRAQGAVPGDPRAVQRVVPTAADGAFVGYGLPPGRYAIDGYLDLPVRRTTAGVVVEVLPGQVEVVQDLALP